MSGEWIVRGVAVLLFDGRESRHGHGQRHGQGHARQLAYGTRLATYERRTRRISRHMHTHITTHNRVQVNRSSSSIAGLFIHTVS